VIAAEVEAAQSRVEGKASLEREVWELSGGFCALAWQAAWPDALPAGTTGVPARAPAALFGPFCPDTGLAALFARPEQALDLGREPDRSLLMSGGSLA
jgi:hypothetical protein